MRRFPTIALALLTTVSCQNVIETDFGRPDPRLVVNAMLNTTESVHRVYLSMRVDSPGGNEFEDVELADVRCFINGKLAAVAERSETPEGGWYSGWAPYCFSARFSPGDNVRIEASRLEKTVYAEVVVPAPVSMELVDTTLVDDGLTTFLYNRTMHVDLEINDDPGADNWFRIGKCYQTYDQRLYFLYNDGELFKSDVVDSYTEDCEILIGADPILNDGYLPSETGLDEEDALGDIFDFLYPSNTFKVFSDKRFEDSKAKVSVSVPVQKARRFYYGPSKDYPSAADITPSLSIEIFSLSKETYNYLKALNAGQNFGYEVNPLVEPVIIPSNVVGGLGFVGVGTASYLEIQLPEYYIEFESRYYF